MCKIIFSNVNQAPQETTDPRTPVRFTNPGLRFSTPVSSKSLLVQKHACGHFEANNDFLLPCQGSTTAHR